MGGVYMPEKWPPLLRRRAIASWLLELGVDKGRKDTEGKTAL
jgi:hypothetical protein